MTTHLNDLYAQRSKLSARISDIESANRTAENAAKVGKAFVYRNAYNHAETWPLYVLVTSIDGCGYFNVFQFETDSRGKTSVSNETRMSMSSDWREIDRAEFDAAWQEARRAIDALHASAVAA